MPISKAVQAVFYLKYSFEEMIFFSHHQSNRMDAAPNIHISCQKHGFFQWLIVKLLHQYTKCNQDLVKAHYLSPVLFCKFGIHLNSLNSGSFY